MLKRSTWILNTINAHLKLFKQNHLVSFYATHTMEAKLMYDLNHYLFMYACSCSKM